MFSLAHKDPRGAHNHKLVNFSFFQTWSSQMAYVLGFIFADGGNHLEQRVIRENTLIYGMGRSSKPHLALARGARRRVFYPERLAAAVSPGAFRRA